MLEWNLNKPKVSTEDEAALEGDQRLVSMMGEGATSQEEEQPSNRFDAEADALQFDLPLRRAAFSESAAEPEPAPDPAPAAEDADTPVAAADSEPVAPRTVLRPVRRRPRAQRVEPARRAAVEIWYRPERILMAVLLVNFLVITILVGLPGGESRSDEPSTPEVRGETPAAPAVPMVEQETSTVGTKPTLPDAELYESGQREVRDGRYEEGRALLERYLATHPDLEPAHLQTVYSSLAYCARRQGLAEDAAAYLAAIENLRYATSTPDELLAAAERALHAGRHRRARMLFARILLEQASLPEDWVASGRLESARIGFGRALVGAPESEGPR